jgi:hypothetical protein
MVELVQELIDENFGTQHIFRKEDQVGIAEENLIAEIK